MVAFTSVTHLTPTINTIKQRTLWSLIVIWKTKLKIYRNESKTMTLLKEPIFGMFGLTFVYVVCANRQVQGTKF